MLRHPTPITDKLESLAASLVASITAGHPFDTAALLRLAEHLVTLARRAAPIERFHAELVAQAAEEELRQPDGPVDSQPGIKGDWCVQC